MKHELIQTENYLLIVDDSKKTIANLPLNGAPVLEGVDLLPPIEGAVGELANIFSNGFQLYLSLDMVGALREGFVSGYNTAKEKYKFTEEDIRKAIDMARMNYDEEGFTINAFTEYEIIKSLQQTKMPVGFECEMDIKCWCMKPENGGCAECNQKPKTTINSQGQTVWVGKYIFND